MPRSSIRRLLACLIGAGLLGASVPSLADEDEPVKVEDPTLPKQELSPQILQAVPARRNRRSAWPI